MLPVLRSGFDLAAKQKQLAALEQEMQAPDFWSDQNTARAKSEKYNALKEQIDFWNELQKGIEELFALASEHIKEQGKDDQVSEADKTYLEQQFASLQKKYLSARIQAFLSGKYDDHSAIVSIHAGAGGSDAQDWTEMLLRMLTRYADKRKYKVEILEISKGGEAGIKSVTFEVLGHNAYGYFKSEAGVHRKFCL